MKSRSDIIQHSLFEAEPVPGQHRLFSGRAPENTVPRVDEAAGLAAVTSGSQANCSSAGSCAEAPGASCSAKQPEADIMFVGEGPGKDRRRMGRPFVGRAGLGPHA